MKHSSPADSRTGIWLTAALVLLIGTMLASSFGLSPVSAQMPRPVLGLTLFALLLQFAREWKSAYRAHVGPKEPDRGNSGMRPIVALSWLAALPLAVWVLGVAAGSVGFCLFWLRWHAGESWMRTVALSACLGLAIWLLFGFLLGSALYRGLLGGFFA